MWLLVLTYWLSSLASMVSMFLQRKSWLEITPIDVLAVVAPVGHVVVYLLFSISLLSLKGDLFGLRRAYAYTGIAAAACFLTVALFPLGLLVAMANGVILGLVLVRAADSPADT